MSAPPLTRRAVLCAPLLLAAASSRPQMRGINICNWFRFPPRADPASLRAYMSDAALDGLAVAGFTHVRLPIDPALDAGAVLLEAVARLQARGLTVLVVPHSALWQLETNAADHAALLAFWSRAAALLQAADPSLLWPETANEPVFAGDPAIWDTLQAEVLAAIRAALPDSTCVVTGAAWGGIDGLLQMQPLPDPNLRYSVHVYEPPELTTLAAYRPGLDRAALARLPFPVQDADACRAAALSTDSATNDVAAFYCAQFWTAARVTARLEQAADWGRANGVAVMLGEFGATAALTPAARLAWIAALRVASERLGLGWALWGYEDVMGFALPRPPPDDPALDPALLAALGLRAPG